MIADVQAGVVAEVPLTKKQRACFNYRNLQPLWAKENISKSNKTLDAEVAHA
jgi:hypothetical protein